MAIPPFHFYRTRIILRSCFYADEFFSLTRNILLSYFYAGGVFRFGVAAGIICASPVLLPVWRLVKLGEKVMFISKM